jgi:ankyrin repeat protein
MTSDTLVTVILAGSLIIFTYVLLFVGRKSKPAQATSPNENCPYLDAISKVDENGDTKLMVLCGEGDFKGVEKLLQSVSSETTTGKCPFQFGSSTTTQLMDTFVVDVNAVNDDGETALMFAAENGHDVVVHLLLDTTQGTFVAPSRLIISYFH